MRRRIKILLVLAIVAFGIPGWAAIDRGGSTAYSAYRASVYVSGHATYFYDALAPYGSWFELSPYGWVWCPIDAPVGWRPYTVGYWVYTDWGWMWISEDPWGWAPYHYGRWAYSSYYGWVWVPGNVWAPAWVAWRYGDGWVGWAALPPDVSWRVGVGISYTSYNFDSRIRTSGWCFVPVRDLGTRRIRTRVLPPSRNTTLLRSTRNVTRYEDRNSQPVERGLRVDVIERDSGRRIPRYRVADSDRPGRGRGPVIRGTTIEVNRPRAGARLDREERLKPPPGRRPAQPRALLQRQQAESRRYEERMGRERARLEREHERELRQPPRGVSREELRRRHEAEARAQREQEQHERQVIQEREKQLRRQEQQEQREQQERPRDDSRQQDRGRGRGRGQDRGQSDQR